LSSTKTTQQQLTQAQQIQDNFTKDLKQANQDVKDRLTQAGKIVSGAQNTVNGVSSATSNDIQNVQSFLSGDINNLSTSTAKDIANIRAGIDSLGGQFNGLSTSSKNLQNAVIAIEQALCGFHPPQLPSATCKSLPPTPKQPAAGG